MSETTETQMLRSLSRIYEVWRIFPRLRLGQLIENALGNTKLYYLSDIEFVQSLEIYANTKKSGIDTE